MPWGANEDGHQRLCEELDATTADIMPFVLAGVFDATELIFREILASFYLASPPTKNRFQKKNHPEHSK